MTLAESPAVKYAEWCVIEDNRYVPIYVKKQCAVWLDIVKGLDSEAYVCEKTFRKIRKILRLMIHPDLQKPLSVCMEEYAWLLIVAVFSTKTRDGNYRLYQTALLEICRKNFKTFYSGVIFIIGMIIEPRFSRFYSVAPDLKLSKEFQTAIKKIIKSSPDLISNFKALRSEVRCLINENEYTPLAYSEDNMDGKLANMFLADEAGNMDDYPVEAMRSSQITLRNKLGIIISTQYPNDNNVMLTEIDYAKQVLDELIEDKQYFALLYEPNDDVKAGDKWQTEDLVLYQSNPVAYVYPYIFDDLKKKRAKAILYENKRENFLCKHCNIQYKSLGVEGFIEITKLRECRIEENPEFWRGRRVWLGLDLSMTEDNTSVAMVTEDDGMLYAKVWGFVPQDRIEAKIEKERLDYRALIKAGVCFGVDFAESSNTSVEMQLNENKQTNMQQICSLFCTPYEMITGKASAESQKQWVKNCIIPLLNVIEAAVDSDLLTEAEKATRYFAFDTAELTRGDFKERMEGYAIALHENILDIDEVRAKEDYPPRGFNFMKLGLQDVLLDLKTNRIYTPNTNQFQDLGAVIAGNKIMPTGTDERAYIQDPKTGKMMGRTPEKGLTSAPNGDIIKSSENSDYISATGPNEFKRGFDAYNLSDHWYGGNGMHSHKDEYPNMTMYQYADKAYNLIQQPTSSNVLGHKTKDGNVVRYDKATKDFVKGNPNIGIKTMFKASEEYYKKQRNEDLKEE